MSRKKSTPNRRSPKTRLLLETLEPRNLLSGGQLQFGMVGPLNVQEGTTALIPVVRTGDTTGAVSVDYTIAVPGNLLPKFQATPGTDFQGSLSGTVNFQVGDSQENIAIPIMADLLVETTEEFNVTLMTATGGATLGAQIEVSVDIQDQNLPIVPYVPPESSNLQAAAAGFGETAEHYQSFVTNTYQTFLGRQPDSAGLDYWATAMQLYQTSSHSHGLNQSQIEASFLASPEYLNRFGGVGEAWVRGLYQNLLNRTADAGGLQFWLAHLTDGGSATTIALGFSNSTEWLTDRVTATYQIVLGRAPDPAGLSFWLDAFQAGGTTEDMNTGFVASPEYYNKPDGAAGNPAAWVREAYLDLLFRPANTDEASHWLSTVSPQITPEVPPLERLARFVPNNSSNPYVPQSSDWVTVANNDSKLKGDVVVVAHGFAYGYGTLVQNYEAQNHDILKWWQTIDPNVSGSLGPNASEMFIGADNGGSPPIDITPTGLANAILAADPKAVVLAYSWLDESASDDLTGDSLSEAYTQMNGVRLARALEMALPTNFQSSGGELHLIGHSHGSKVATVAAVTLQRDGNANDHVSHLTILDSPEDGATASFDSNGSNSLWYYLGALNIGTGSGQTFVDNYISYLDSPIGPIQGFDPLDTNVESSSLQNVVDVDVTAGTDALDLGPTDSHGYAFNWYSGAIQNWVGNTTPNSVLGGEPVLNPNDLESLDGSYTQTMTQASDPQFVLSAGPQTNTQTVSTVFTNLSFTSDSVSKGSSYDGTNLKLAEAGNGSGAEFTGKFDVVGGNFSGQFSGISFNYQFTNPGQGDQLLIYVNTSTLGDQELHYAMTGTVANTQEQFATLSLGSLAHDFHGTMEVELVSPNGSTGAAVTITNMQQYTIPA